MLDVSVVLAVLVAAVSLTAAVALALTARALGAGALAAPRVGTDLSAMQGAVRTAGRRGMLASLVTVVTLVLIVVVCNVAFRDAVGDVVFAAPLVAGAAGIGTYALLQARRLPAPAAGRASLVARRPDGFAQRRSFTTMAAVVALLLAAEAFAVVVTPQIAVFNGGKAVLLVLLVGVVVVVEVQALRQIALRPALPTTLAEVDLTIRQVATRFVLLLASGALLATAALVALQSGGWLVNTGALLTEVGSDGAVAGATVAALGVLMAIGSLGAIVAAGIATVRHSRSAARMTAHAMSVSA